MELVLDRAKSEVLVNIYSLLTQLNIKSCNVKRQRQRKQPEKSVGLIYIANKTLHVQHTFFVHFFAVVLHDFNVNISDTSQLNVAYVFLFTFFCYHSFSPW